MHVIDFYTYVSPIMLVVQGISYIHEQDKSLNWEIAMKLTKYTDYGFRLLIYLALLPDGRRASVDEISQKYKVSRNNLNKIVHQLSKQDIVDTKQGKGGGLRLKKVPQEINVGEIVLLLESQIHVDDTDHILKAPIQQAIQSFVETLKRHTLADLLNNRKNDLAKILDLNKPD